MFSSFFKPGLYPLAKCFLGTCLVSAAYNAYLYKDFNSSTYNTCSNNFASYGFSAINSIITGKGNFKRNAAASFYLYSGACGLCAYAATGSTFGLILGVASIISQLKWCYKEYAKTAYPIFLAEPDTGNNVETKTGNNPKPQPNNTTETSNAAHKNQPFGPLYPSLDDETTNAQATNKTSTSTQSQTFTAAEDERRQSDNGQRYPYTDSINIF